MGRNTLLALLTVALMSSGCATKKYVRKERDTTNKRIDSVEASVEANETRIRQNEEAIGTTNTRIDKTRQEVAQVGREAEEAKRMARGKLLYQVILNNNSVRFDVNEAELTDDGKQQVLGLIQRLKTENKNVYVEIEGHTDNTGTAEHNYDLGLTRAKAIRRFMAEEGIPLHRIGVISFGETRPIGDNTTREGRAMNRRVVISVLE